MLPAHYNPKMSSPPNPWLEDVTGSSMAKCDNLNPHYNVMTSVSPSASSLTANIFESGPMPTPTKWQNPTIMGSSGPE